MIFPPIIIIEYELENASSNQEDLEAADGWLAECLKDTEIQSCSDDLYASSFLRTFGNL